MIRFRTATSAVAASSLLILAACSPEVEETPPAPVEPSPAAAAPATAAVGYACESGQTVTVAYPSAETAELTYRDRTYALRGAPSASGARYAGAGLEWRMAIRDGQENTTLSRLGPNQDVGVAVLERCSRPATSAIPGGPARVPVSGVPTPTAAPCRGPQLKLTNEGGDAGMGHRVAILALQNVGAQPCSLTGYPTVSLLDTRGRPLPTIRSQQTPGSYFRQGQAPTPVTLTPQGKAFFDLAWTVVPNEGQGETACPAATRVRVTAPGDTAPVVLAQELSPCGGKVDVSPIRPVAEPAPRPAAS